jgi:hypothetical protein
VDGSARPRASKLKLKHWRGVSGIFGLKGATELEFVVLMRCQLRQRCREVLPNRKL